MRENIECKIIYLSQKLLKGDMKDFWQHGFNEEMDNVGDLKQLYPVLYSIKNCNEGVISFIIVVNPISDKNEKQTL